MRNASPVALGVLALILAVVASTAPGAEVAADPMAMAARSALSGDAPVVAALSSDALMIERLRDRWLAAVNTADLRGVLAAYAPGAVVLPDSLPPFLGAANIGRWHQRWLPLADVHYSMEATLLYIDGEWALEEWVADVTVAPRGDELPAIGDDPLQFRQSGVRVYRKGPGGRWRIDRETWSADHPAVQKFTSTSIAAGAKRTC